jgi:hypothetical protein
MTVADEIHAAWGARHPARRASQWHLPPATTMCLLSVLLACFARAYSSGVKHDLHENTKIVCITTGKVSGPRKGGAGGSLSVCGG